MIAQIKKVNIISPKEHQEEILDVLYTLGIAHIINAKKTDEEELEELDKEIDDVKLKLSNVVFSLGFIKNNTKTKESFKQKLTSEKKTLSFSQINKNASKLDIDKISETISKIEKNLEAGKSKLEEIEQKLKNLEPWINLKELPDDTKFTKTIIGFISLNKYLDFIRAIEESVKEVEIEKVYDGTRDVYIIISFLKNKKEQIDKIIEKFNFTKVEIESKEEAPSITISKLRKEKREIKSNLKKWRIYTKELKKYTEPLKMAEDSLRWKLDKLEAKRKLISTKFFTIIQIWIKKNDIKSLKSALKDISKNIEIEEVKSHKDTPPVVLENKNFITPFETVTGIYGMPKYNEIDPTPYLAPFFIIFFALCLTDAGYGLVIALGSFLAIKLLKIPREKQRLWRLLGYGGIITFFIGALFGGWFGIDVKNLQPGPVKSFIEFFRIIDPIENTLLFMIIAFALGIVQIWFAQIVKIISSLKNKNKGDAYAGLAWSLFIAAGALFVIGKYTNLLVLTIIAKYALFASVAGLIIIESRNVKNIFIKPLVGVISIIQGLIGIMSDTLSYSRLMALGLATGIIAFIINTIAGIFRDLIPYIGWIVWAGILIGGHIFNIGINALGGFIHSGRLQFVEFFPKFLEGGGERFSPFKITSKYFKLKV